MIEMLESFQLPATHWAVVAVCAMLVGFAKTGIGGMGVVIVPALAWVFGARPSTGILLPMLCISDIMAVTHYRRHAHWRHVLRPMPWAVAGVLVGVVVGHALGPDEFRRLLGGVVLFVIGLMIWREWGARRARRAGDEDRLIHHGPWFAALVGLTGGFATMIANAAGPIWMIYLLATGLSRFEFIGTGAWFFFILNLFKVPFHVFVWKTITVRTFLLDVAMVPAMIAGALLGILVVKKINERVFRLAVQILALASALRFLIG